MSSNSSDEPSATTIVLSITYTLIICLIAFTSLGVYCRKLYPSVPLANIAAFLLMNQLLGMLSQIPSLLVRVPRWLCLTSTTTNVFFQMASVYWLIAIARLLYLQKINYRVRKISLDNYIRRHLLHTYLSAACLALFFLVCALLDNTPSQSLCYAMIQEKHLLDYLAYFSASCLPSMVMVVGVTGFLIAYYRLPEAGFQIHPLIDVILCFGVAFNAVSLVLTIVQFTSEQDWHFYPEIFKFGDAALNVLLLMFVVQRVRVVKKRQEGQAVLNEQYTAQLEAYDLQLVTFGVAQEQLA